MSAAEAQQAAKTARSDLLLTSLLKHTKPLRKGATETEREARESALHLSAEDFNTLVDELYEGHKSLVQLHEFIGSKDNRRCLFTSPEGHEVVLTRAELKHFEKQYEEGLKSLKRFYRGANKKPREKADPALFKGVHSPILVGDAIKAFLREADFGYRVPKDASSGRLIDSLEYAKNGWMIRNTLNMLYYLAIYNCGLYAAGDDKSYICADAAFKKAFGGSIPALYGFAQDGTKVKFHKRSKGDKDEEGGKGGKKAVVVPNIVKVENKDDANTFTILRSIYVGRKKADNPKEDDPAQNFDENHFKMFFLQAITSLNVFAKEDLPSVEIDDKTADTFLQSETYRAAMLREHEIVSACSAAWEKINGPARAARAAQKTAAAKKPAA